MTIRAVRLKDGGTILRTRRAGEYEHQPEDTYEDSDQDWHRIAVEVRKSERSLVDLSGSAITGSGKGFDGTARPVEALEELEAERQRGHWGPCGKNVSDACRSPTAGEAFVANTAAYPTEA
jgi:hypothetical protein